MCHTLCTVSAYESAKENRFDYLLIESTGISEPLQVAETFTFNDNEGKVLSDFAQLDTMVSMIDAVNFHRDLASKDSLIDRHLSGEGDNRSIVELLMQQVEFANVIIINKIDMVGAKELGEIEAIVRKLNPSAVVYKTNYSDVPLRNVINTGLFDFAKAVDSPGWLKELRGTHVPETLEYGIGSFVYRARKPLHPLRLKGWIANPPAGIVRLKGFVWLASAPLNQVEWEAAGVLHEVELKELWWCELSEELWPDNERFRDAVKADFVDGFGDKRVEIVVIGTMLDREAISRGLDECLLTDAEFAEGPQRWIEYEDPFGMQKQLDEDRKRADAEEEEEGEGDEEEYDEDEECEDECEEEEEEEEDDEEE
jgi:G3E family GTPase